ncbi:hypothetical protein VT85_23990 [Planctomyces sp. SH-PL62]|nr:hypothetical protein VT85_23990 [Planctomyces sp. SH-PL62]
MSLPRSIIRVSSFGILGLGIVGLVAGCGSEQPKTGTTVYSSPEEIQAKNQELQNAMKGGAYGSAGKKSANMVGQ